MVPSDNIVGSVLFVCYVAAALALSPLILFDLGKASWNSHGRFRVNNTHLMLATMVSAVSFAMLSHHMLAFLMKYYNAWALRNRIYATQPYRELLRTLWPWLKGSTLFENFAQTICRGKARFVWTSSALTYSVGWSTFMAVKGNRRFSVMIDYRKLNRLGVERGIPKLWAYFLLIQILPTSYTQNVFAIALLLYPESSSKGTKQTKSRLRILDNNRRWATLLMILTVIAFCNSMWFTRSKVGTGMFIPSLIFTRMLLMAPYIVAKLGGGGSLPSAGDYSSPWVFTGILGLAMSVWQVRSLVEDNHGELMVSFYRIFSALHDDPSVSALGYDLIIGVSSLLVFRILDVL